MTDKNSQKIAQIFYCDKCDYNTSKKNDLKKHFATRKHVNTDGSNRMFMYRCECGKEYQHRQSLHTHKKKCFFKEDDESETEMLENMGEKKNEISNDLIVELIKQNKELQNVLVEQNNKIMEMSKQHTVVNNSTTNNQFNLQFFLNEQCKDAINIMDFLNSLQLQVKDFETTGRLGFVEGISRIIVKGLKQIDVHKRPIHCTDIKREVVYIKDENIWEKQNSTKNKLRQAVNIVAQKNLLQLPKWQEENPECVNIHSKLNDEYIQLSLAALGGQTPEEEAKYMGQIMKNVLREVVIDKK
jgi:hypothetical protein